MCGCETKYYENTGTKGNFWYIYEMHYTLPFGELFAYTIMRSLLITMADYILPNHCCYGDGG